MSKIIITRPVEFALPLQSTLQNLHIDSFIFPTIDIQSIKVESIESADYTIFVSRNAVTYGRHLLNSNSRTLAIGQGTYHALQTAGYTPIIQPQKPYNSEQFLQHPDLPINKKDRVAIIKGQGGREMLKEALQKRAAAVQTIDVYKRKISRPSKQAIQAYQLILKNGCKAIFINSIETLHNLIHITPQETLSTLLSQQLITGSQRVIQAAAESGFTRTPLLADSALDEDMIKCLLKAPQ